MRHKLKVNRRKRAQEGEENVRWTNFIKHRLQIMKAYKQTQDSSDNKFEYHKKTKHLKYTLIKIIIVIIIIVIWYEIIK